MFYSIFENTIYANYFIAKKFGKQFNAKGILFLFFAIAALEIISYLVLYMLRGIAIYKMAKRRGLKNLWLAFVPCACFYLLGKLQDDTVQSAKRNAVWSYIAIISSAVMVVFAIITDVTATIPTLSKILTIQDKTVVITEEYIVSTKLTLVASYMTYFASLVFTVASIFIFMNVYRAYAPKLALRYSIIALAVSVLFGTDLLFSIFLFTLRNRERVNYKDYLKDKMGEYSRYYGPFGVYGQDRGGTNERSEENNASPDSDPFAEFSDNSDDPFTDSKGNGFGGNNSDYTYSDPYKNSNDKDDDLF